MTRPKLNAIQKDKQLQIATVFRHVSKRAVRHGSPDISCEDGAFGV